MDLSHLVVAHVEHWVPHVTQRSDKLAFLPLAFGQLHANKNLRRLSVSITVVELCDGALAQRLDKPPVAARPLRDGDGEQRFASFADFGALGDMTQAIEVEICAAVDRDKPSAAQVLALGVPLQPGEA